ncbi:hypothetical protein D9M69_682390 [compost metagenome]
MGNDGPVLHQVFEKPCIGLPRQITIESYRDFKDGSLSHFHPQLLIVCKKIYMTRGLSEISNRKQKAIFTVCDDCIGHARDLRNDGRATLAHCFN